MSRAPLILIFIALIAAAADAQPLERRGYRPVEQIAGDTDPLARSLRRAEPGLGERGGQATRVYRQAGGERLYYIAPGITASYDRSGYQWIKEHKKDWKLYQLIPPNTVFHLGPPPVEPPPETAAPNAIRDKSLVDARVTGAVLASERGEVTYRRDERAARWASYAALRKAQQRAVVTALGELK